MTGRRLPRIDHVQLAVPAGAEEPLRSFYGGALGLPEVAKPPALAGRGGLWFRAGELELHLGVEAGFRPALKAHPAIAVADLDSIVARLEQLGHPARFDGAIPGLRRCYVHDPVGNRLELIASGDR